MYSGSYIFESELWEVRAGNLRIFKIPDFTTSIKAVRPIPQGMYHCPLESVNLPLKTLLYLQVSSGSQVSYGGRVSQRKVLVPKLSHLQL